VDSNSHISTSTAAPFDAVATEYDESFTNTLLGRRKRNIVHRYLEGIIQPGLTALELNCGTGEDARWLAEHGVDVLATDISGEMLRAAKRKIHQSPKRSHVRLQNLAIEGLRSPSVRRELGRFDLIFSNFDGLNCLEDISWLPDAIASLLKPGADAVFVLMPPFCLTHSIHQLLKGKPRHALGRNRTPTVAIGGGAAMQTWFHSPGYLKSLFAAQFSIETIQAVGLITPPTTLRAFYQRHHRTFARFNGVEDALSGLPVLRTIGDHVLLHIRLK
jgi:SAM-dependent methyltransferase